jgi:hypothetical protein
VAVRESGRGPVQTALINDLVDELIGAARPTSRCAARDAASGRGLQAIAGNARDIYAGPRRHGAAGALDVGFDAANGDLDATRLSIFATAANAAKARTGMARLRDGLDREKAEIDEPGMVVMRADPHVKVGPDNVTLFKNLNGVKLPQTIVGGLSAATATMWREYSHDVVTVQLLMRDLREGQRPTSSRCCC